MRKKLLIVGGTGFIGYHLAKKCLLKNYSITSLSYNKPKKKRFLNLENKDKIIIYIDKIQIY